ACRKESVLLGSWSVLSNKSIWTLSKNDCLQVFAFAQSRQQEGRLFPGADWTKQASFEDPALLRRTLHRKGIARIQMLVAKEEVEGSVVVIGGALGDDFDAPAAPARVFSRVGVLIDLDLLNRRSGHANIAGLHAVNNQRNSTVRIGRIQESRQGRHK